MSSAAPLAGERVRAALLVILIGAVVIRLAYLVSIAGTAFPKFPLAFDQSDMHAFWQWAQAIRAGDWWGRETYHPYFEWMREMAPPETWYRWWGGKAIFQQAPLYPYAVAGLLAVSRGSLEFVLAVQLLVGALQPLVMFWLGRRLFDERVGLVAAAVTALYGPFVFHQAVLLRDWLPPILEPLALVALLRAEASGRPRDWCVAGAALGAALMLREAVLVFLPIAALWLTLTTRSSRRRTAVLGVALVAGFTLVLSPLVVRNALVGAPPLALSNRAGEAFIVGNAADAFPIGLVHPPSMAGILARSDGRTAAVVAETLKTWDGDWRGIAASVLLRLRALADPLEVPNNVDIRYGREISPALRFTLSYGAIFPIGLIGFALAVPSWRRHLLLALFGASLVAGMAATTVLERYRIGLAPVVIVYGAVAVVYWWDAVRTRRIAGALGCSVAVAAAAVLQHLILPIPTLRDNPAVSVYPPSYLVAAHIYGQDGRPDRALAEIERLTARAAERPGFADLAAATSLSDGDYRVLWAARLLSAGRVDEARAQAERAAGSYAAHPERRYPLYNLGFLYLKLGARERARDYFQRFLAEEPTGPAADRARGALAALDGAR